METDYQKLLNACKEYRDKLDEAFETNDELHERLSTIYAERDELQKENTKLKDALKEEKIDRSLDGWNEAAIINDLKRENSELKERLFALSGELTIAKIKEYDLLHKHETNKHTTD